MKPQYKAVLLSGLVFPGLGYLPFKRYYRGAFIIALTGINLFGLIQIMLMQTQILIDQVMAGQVTQDLPSMLAAMEEISQIGMGWQDYSGYILLACWLVSIVDGYMLGKAIDKKIDKQQYQ